MDHVLDDLVDAVVAGMPALLAEAGFGDGVRVQRHGGRLTLSDIQRLGAIAPVVLVVGLGKRRIVAKDRTGRHYEAVLAVYAVAKDTEGVSGTAWAARLADAISDRLPGRNWGLDDVEGAPANSIQAVNGYSGEIDSIGLALWAVTWTQEVDTR